MAKYLLIESKSPWESGDVGYAFGLARDLASAGNEVTLYLVQNAVMPLRKGAKDGGLGELISGGKVKVLADDFSLRERAIGNDKLVGGVKVAGIETVVDALADGVKAIWH
jgi:predicted peroxiredoxin